MIYNYPEKYLSPAKTLKALEDESINYLHKKPIDLKSLPNHEKHSIALAQYMFEKEQQDRTLFHMTVTYKPYQNIVYTEKDINVFFKNFYIKNFLPYLMNTRNYCTVTMKQSQPVTFAFVDEHEHQSKSTRLFDAHSNSYIDVVDFAVRLHHHVILAVHNKHYERMTRLVGTNTLANNSFSPKIMTSNIKECEPLRLLYASKNLSKYPDFMSFPDKYSRSHNKYTN